MKNMKSNRFNRTAVIASAVIIVPILSRTNGRLAAQTGAAVAAGSVGCSTSNQTPALGFSYWVRVPSSANASYTVTRDTPLPDEPMISNIEPNSQAAERVQPGDRIARVNGYAVTTAEGSAALRNARPGTSLVLTLRRGEKLVPVTITPPGWRCSAPQGFGAGGVAIASRSASPVTVPYTAATPSVIREMQTPRETHQAVTFSGTILPTMANAGWLGIGFDCSNCGQRPTSEGRIWYFNEPPVIYNVDTGSPAYNAGIRRGDVLVRVDGKDVTSQAAGTRLGLVKPGETLHLTYRRDGKQRNASVKVAPSPMTQRGTALHSAGQLLKSTQELRLSANETRVRSLMRDLETSRSVQEQNLKTLEATLKESGNTSQTRAAISRMRASQEAQAKREKQLLSEMLRVEQEGAKKLELVEQEMKHATTVVGQPTMLMLDSVAFRTLPRDQRLRYSGSIGDADIEVRGPGSVSVQGDDGDLVIITGDAVIRIKNRKSRDRN
jgi:S1-C subfamily serine protease